jgi:hypothetical protein
MKRCVEGEHRSQSTLFPERPDENIAEHSPVRVIDVCVDWDLKQLVFMEQSRWPPAARPAIAGRCSGSGSRDT